MYETHLIVFPEPFCTPQVRFLSHIFYYYLLIHISPDKGGFIIPPATYAGLPLSKLKEKSDSFCRKTS
jgi:hypothetical protein